MTFSSVLLTCTITLFCISSYLIHTIQSQNTYAAVVLTPTSGYNVSGTIYFEETPNSVLVFGSINGLLPNTLHGFHVHQWGLITTADGTGTGGHYNPTNVEHACPPTVRHIGDMGNILADASGIALVSKLFISNELPLTGPNNIIGRGVIVHADVDDRVTQPTGNSGKRVAQGVIGYSPPITMYYKKQP
eukprot:TRINITY_DN19531_c0_g1_i1.p1 TRINITY_DN19531_c0_g1~~TRINITY_DN19531_c0_g1_i1.p1  ORF type:complete len:189 (-),score=28.90 TRINITY_DN19531_c0_g1_i1:83-649(-)